MIKRNPRSGCWLWTTTFIVLSIVVTAWRAGVRALRGDEDET